MNGQVQGSRWGSVSVVQPLCPSYGSAFPAAHLQEVGPPERLALPVLDSGLSFVNSFWPPTCSLAGSLS